MSSMKAQKEIFLLETKDGPKGIYSSLANCKSKIYSILSDINSKLKEEYKYNLQEEFNKKFNSGELFNTIYQGENKNIFKEFEYDENKFLQIYSDKYIEISKISIITENNFIKLVYKNQILFIVKKMILDEGLSLSEEIHVSESQEIPLKNHNCICGGTGIITKKIRYGFTGNLKEVKEKCKNCDSIIDRRKLPVWTNSNGERVRSFESPGDDFVRGLFYPSNKKRKRGELTEDEFSEEVVPQLKPISGLILVPNLNNNKTSSDSSFRKMNLLANLVTNIEK